MSLTTIQLNSDHVTSFLKRLSRDTKEKTKDISVHIWVTYDKDTHNIFQRERTILMTWLWWFNWRLCSISFENDSIRVYTIHWSCPSKLVSIYLIYFKKLHTHDHHSFDSNFKLSRQRICFLSCASWYHDIVHWWSSFMSFELTQISNWFSIEICFQIEILDRQFEIQILSKWLSWDFVSEAIRSWRMS